MPTVRQVLNTYRIGDSRRLAELCPAEEFVDVTITSPPYWNLKDYGVKKQIGFGQDYRACLQDLSKVFHAIYSITKPTGSLWIVVDTIKENGELKLFPFDLAAELQTHGWILHDIIVWNKDKTLPWSHRGKLRNIFEYVLFFTKTKSFKYHLSKVRDLDDLKEWWIKYPERYSPLGKAPSRTWSIPIPRQGSWGANWVRHYCPLPPELVRRMILLTTDQKDTVLDPFSGSGVVLAQAAAMQRAYVGLDISGRYRRVFSKQVLPSLVRLEAQYQETCRLGKDRRKLFEKSIWTLRRLKVARELQRLYESHFGILDASFLFLSSHTERDVDVCVVFKNKVKDVGTRISNLSKLLSRPPLSKYELQIKISGVRQNGGGVPKAISERFGVDRDVFQYNKGVTSKVWGKVPLKSIFENGKGNGAGGCRRFVPIVSDIEPESLLTQLH